MDHQLTVRLPEELSRALEAASRRMQLKTSEIVRMALREFLQVPAAKGPRPADRVRGLIGSLRSGVPDLAERHREVILDALKHAR